MRFSISSSRPIDLQRYPVLLIAVLAAGLVSAAFAPASDVAEPNEQFNWRQLAQTKTKGSDAQKGKSTTDAEKGKGSTGQCPAGKTFVPSRGRGAGTGAQCI